WNESSRSSSRSSRGRSAAELSIVLPYGSTQLGIRGELWQHRGTHKQQSAEGDVHRRTSAVRRRRGANGPRQRRGATGIGENRGNAANRQRPFRVRLRRRDTRERSAYGSRHEKPQGGDPLLGTAANDVEARETRNDVERTGLVG